MDTETETQYDMTLRYEKSLKVKKRYSMDMENKNIRFKT